MKTYTVVEIRNTKVHTDLIKLKIQAIHHTVTDEYYKRL
jgi:hypothetical protein